MRYILTITLILISIITFGQKLNEEMKAAFKNDDIAMLLTELKENKFTLNDCFLVEDNHYSLLSISIRMDKPKIFDGLVTEKAELDKACNDKTPLMYACKYGRLAMAKRLVTAGASISLTNKRNETALDYARRYENKELETYLLPLK